MFLKQSLIDERFPIPICFIISNSDSDQFEFSYLTKLLSAFNRNSSLDAFHDQVLDEEVPRWSELLISTYFVLQTTRVLGLHFR